MIDIVPFSTLDLETNVPSSERPLSLERLATHTPLTLLGVRIRLVLGIPQGDVSRSHVMGPMHLAGLHRIISYQSQQAKRRLRKK